MEQICSAAQEKEMFQKNGINTQTIDWIEPLSTLKAASKVSLG